MMTLTAQSSDTSRHSLLGSHTSSSHEDGHSETGNEEASNWSTTAIVQLHMILLDQLAHLADPAAPLEEKLELLQWVYTDRNLDQKPFSFANCIKLCGRSINPHCGLMSADEVRDELAHYIPRWLNESLALYPVWVQQAVRSNPAYVSRKLSADPQFINREARRKLKSGDLFQAEACEHVQ